MLTIDSFSFLTHSSLIPHSFLTHSSLIVISPDPAMLELNARVEACTLADIEDRLSALSLSAGGDVSEPGEIAKKCYVPFVFLFLFLSRLLISGKRLENSTSSL